LCCTLAVIDENIVAVEETEKRAYQAAQKFYPELTPLVVYIPINEELECLYESIKFRHKFNMF